MLNACTCHGTPLTLQRLGKKAFRHTVSASALLQQRGQGVIPNQDSAPAISLGASLNGVMMHGVEGVEGVYCGRQENSSKIAASIS